ncbi:hypothetical protein T12_5178 [Trichinella patagoniensis]|uniref:Uncharacterized protein n=1 Tax=Trichinella patagoniensis TaxID=990121 RepID=A0A0V0Z310_9BILA|nr:hypothetical protein T12_9599 [Trichinella patagoniensis]KRY07132.1 hypothetical protein T12_5178 [Trichinella patagoniensis]
MDYVIIRKFLFSRSRCHSQIAFPTVLMFFLVTQGELCVTVKTSRIFNDLHRIIIMAWLSSSRCVQVNMAYLYAECSMELQK